MVTTNKLNNTSSPFDVDNIHLETNTISSTNTNGPVIIDPNGTGDLQVTTGDVSLSAGAGVIDPGGATDSYVQYNESTTGKWRTGNDATDDSYRISQGSALGTNDTYILTSGGLRTRPLQSSFVVNNGAGVSNVTGNGTTYTIVYDTEQKDIGSDFNTTTGVYTAPEDGIYIFHANALLSGLTASHTVGYIVIFHGSQNTGGFGGNYAFLRNSSNELNVTASALVNLSASATAYVNVYVYNGTKVVDVFSRFCGGLLHGN